MPLFDNPVVILVAFIAMILIAVGLITFIVTAIGRRQSPKEPNKPIPAVTSATTSATTAATVPAATSTPPTPAQTFQESTPYVEPAFSPSSPGEVMRVIREPQTGRILVQVNGQNYAHIREIQDAQVGRQVLWAIADLIRFTGGMAANPQALKSVAPPDKSPASAAQPPSSGAEQTGRQPVTPTAQPERVPTPPVTRPTMTPPPVTTPVYRPVTQPPEPPSISNLGQTVTTFFRRGLEPAQTVQVIPFIAQIEAILQRRIEELPEPLPVEVHVQSAPDGSLQIEVGFQVYHSPAEVPDPKIRQLIQDAVAEWERR